MKWFRGGLVSKAHRLVYHSTRGSSVTKKRKMVYLRAMAQAVWRLSPVTTRTSAKSASPSAEPDPGKKLEAREGPRNQKPQKRKTETRNLKPIARNALAGDGARGLEVVTRDHAHHDPRALAVLDRCRHLHPARVRQPSGRRTRGDVLHAGVSFTSGRLTRGCVRRLTRGCVLHI